MEEDGRYAIVDLQSANGVRVNGEDYGKVELRRGDHVDLGHVRLRFVEPGRRLRFLTATPSWVDLQMAGGRRAIPLGLPLRYWCWRLQWSWFSMATHWGF